MKTEVRGRKKVIYDEEVLFELIKQCVKEENVIGKLKYLQIYRFCLNKYENKEIEFKLSEDFWRKPNKQGTELLEKYNNSLVSTKTQEFVVLSEAVSISELSNDKKLEKIIKHNEKGYLKLTEKYEDLLNKNKDLEEELVSEKEKNKKLKEEKELLNELIFKIMEYSSDKDVDIKNIINTGLTRDPLVDQHLKDIFNDEYKTEVVKEKNSNVISINKNRTAQDDFGVF